MRGFDESPEEFTFVSVIDDPRRFTKSRNVGAYLGLTPRCYQSGEVDRSGRIFKCGDAPMCGQQKAWLLRSIRLAAALGMALLAMQAPAVTREYQAALLQLVRSSDQEIAQRKASAQRFYGIAPEEDEGRFLAQLRAVEPSNA